jgi:hypothetical protein
MSRGRKEQANDGEATLADDQAKRAYYYDDAYGYERYKPDEEEAEAEEAEGCVEAERPDPEA